ncbi:MAG: hypothetical protein QOD48_570 [Gaiellaceae bacterium]|jgi:hypothetical protein|nr:hypothetical protein [Gaiellaceae bacterium]
MDSTVAFCVREVEDPALEVRVNFGVFAGRHATPAEIDDLARAIHEELDTFTIVAEQRHEFAGEMEAALHQVVIEVAHGSTNGDIDALCKRLVALAESWAEECFASRHSGLGNLY